MWTIGKFFIFCFALFLFSAEGYSQEDITEIQKSESLKQLAIDLNLTLQQQSKLMTILQSKQIVSSESLIELEKAINELQNKVLTLVKQSQELIKTLQEQSTSLDESEKETRELKELLKLLNENMIQIKTEFATYKTDAEKRINDLKFQRNSISIVSGLVIILLIIF